MKTLIDKIEGLRGIRTTNYNKGVYDTVMEVVDIIKSHPVIQAKALRKRGTDKWYHIDPIAFDDGKYPFRTGRFPDLWHEYFRHDGIGFVAEANLPPDAELVNLTIIVEGGEPSSNP